MVIEKDVFVTTTTKVQGKVRSIIKRENDTIVVILLKDQSCREFPIEMIVGYDKE